jgi:hypothetical protein
LGLDPGASVPSHIRAITGCAGGCTNCGISNREADEEECPMRPVPPCAADRIGAAVPSARVSLQGSRQALSSRGLRSVPTPAARTCRRTQHFWGRTRGLVSRSRAYCAALGTAPRRTGAKATMLRIETFAPARRCTAPSTCSRRRGSGRQALGAMTAALVIVPADPVRLSRPAQRGRAPGSTVEPREVREGAPWMVRLSMGSADVMLRVTSAARLAPARTHFLGSRR